jgi:uroporphyrinogen-III synthase
MRPIVVTRPGAAGRVLAARLRQSNEQVAWWPAFELLPAADENAVRSVLHRLADYDLALFVSMAAVEATRELLPGPWPVATAIAAVGASTRAAAAELPGVVGEQIISPGGADAPGSEGLWRAWLASGRKARRVLVLRAEHGRDWLIEQFTATGAQVETLPVYRREVRALDAADLACLRQWVVAQTVPLAVFTSSEAVAALDHALASDSARQWLRTGTALATHSRVAEQLQHAGFSGVITVAADDDAIITKLESLAA